MKIIAALLITLFLAGCGTTTTLTNSHIQKDTLITFAPKPIHDTVFVEGQQPTGIVNKDCDTTNILAMYGSFTQSKDDSSGTNWKVKWDAEHRKLTIAESRQPEKVNIPVGYWTSTAEIKKRSISEWLGIAGIGAFMWTGIVIIGYVAFKVGISSLKSGLPI
jgi:hypothetical protein